MYPLDSIKLANILENDKDDTFLHLVDQFETKGRRVRSIEMYKNLVASYDDNKEGLKDLLRHIWLVLQQLMKI